MPDGQMWERDLLELGMQGLPHSKAHSTPSQTLMAMFCRPLPVAMFCRPLPVFPLLLLTLQLLPMANAFPYPSRGGLPFPLFGFRQQRPPAVPGYWGGGGGQIGGRNVPQFPFNWPPHQQFSSRGGSFQRPFYGQGPFGASRAGYFPSNIGNGFSGNPYFPSNVGRNFWMPFGF